MSYVSGSLTRKSNDPSRSAATAVAPRSLRGSSTAVSGLGGSSSPPPSIRILAASRSAPLRHTAAARYPSLSATSEYRPGVMSRISKFLWSSASAPTVVSPASAGRNVTRALRSPRSSRSLITWPSIARGLYLSACDTCGGTLYRESQQPSAHRYHGRCRLPLRAIRRARHRFAWAGPLTRARPLGRPSRSHLTLVHKKWKSSNTSRPLPSRRFSGATGCGSGRPALPSPWSIPSPAK